MEQNTPKIQTQEKLVDEEKAEQLIQCLPKSNLMGCTKLQLVGYQGSWIPANRLPLVLSFQRHFCARDADIILTSLPKTGTTWLKALLFSIVNRDRHPFNQSPLLNHHPHELVRSDSTGQLNELPSPRLLHSHLPYGSLPESIKTCACKILHIARNPFDTFVSYYHFIPNVIKKVIGEDFQPPCIEDCFQDFVEGKIAFGPYFEHIVGYWKQSLEQPNKVLFIKYEDLKDDPIFSLKRLAEFAGFPFSHEEENQGVIKDIIEVCDINNLKELEVNKSGRVMQKELEKKLFFRKGKVGDWTNYFTPPMIDRMNALMEEKLTSTGLSFKLLSNS